MLSNVPGDKAEECQVEISVLHQETGNELQSDQFDGHRSLAEKSGTCHTAMVNEGTIHSILT